MYRNELMFVYLSGTVHINEHICKCASMSTEKLFSTVDPGQR